MQAKTDIFGNDAIWKEVTAEDIVSVNPMKDTPPREDGKFNEAVKSALSKMRVDTVDDGAWIEEEGEELIDGSDLEAVKEAGPLQSNKSDHVCRDVSERLKVVEEFR